MESIKLMNREQAIFLEVMDDLDFNGILEPLIFSYHDFLSGYDFSISTDLEIQKRARECMKKYMIMQDTSICFYDQRWEILKTLDLDAAEWDYLDQIGY
ncbi:hypothetical protein GC093_19125 [Paenibacillus sp. LMG 31456]|uniref:Uncharacterized protein n=1 Tax=Paenibacillus foliorum TaxID=2654974 RepID=A0A972GR30_9BACL|nr:hypothetical protein [Paenibacillus foliorum]NOU95321.1 hypothetical protein [Paenibacillus foliorum]